MVIKKKKKRAYTRLAIFLIGALSRCVEQQKIFLAGHFEFILGILSVAMKTAEDVVNGCKN